MGINIKIVPFIGFILLVVLSCNQGKKGDNQNHQDNKDDIALDNMNINQLSQEIRNTPRNADLFRKRAELYIEKGETEKAISDLNVALKLDSLTKSTYYDLIDQHIHLGQSGKAKEVANACLTIYPNDKESMLRLAQIYYYVKDYNQALSYIRGIKNRNLQDADTYFIQGLIYSETEKTDLAIKAFQRCIEYDKEHIAAYVMLGRLLSDANDPLAIEYFRSGLRQAPGNIELHYNSGFYFQQHDQIDSALYHYNYIISEVDSLHYGAHYNKAYIALVYQNDYEKAIEGFNEALKIDSVSYKAYYNRGYAYELLGKTEKARAEYNKALEYRENYPLAIEALNELDRQ
ncbi:MAG: tetratricopeptide repeat protein [Bacteroidota bacterium]|nr:tetratricopeptide repeat protein [Bacteroidota bacterium]